jgi:transcriptional regulator with XRE-family HTH domain
MVYPSIQMPTPHLVALTVARVLRKLGADLRDARLRRRLSMQIVADRARTTRVTLTRIERGDPAVSMGIYCSVLNVLGLLDGVAMLADVATDHLGAELEASRLPRRTRGKGA